MRPMRAASHASSIFAQGVLRGAVHVLASCMYGCVHCCIDVFDVHGLEEPWRTTVDFVVGNIGGGGSSWWLGFGVA